MKKALNLFELICLGMLILIGSTVRATAAQLITDPVEHVEVETVFIHALSGLKLREAPGTHSETIAVIQYGDQVEIISERNKENSFDNRDGWHTGSWVKVKYHEIVGYVFDGYTSKLPIPIMDNENMDCQDPAHALMVYIENELDQSSTLDTILNRVNDYNVQIKIKQALKYGIEGIYRQHDSGYSTELRIPEARVLDGYNLINGLFVDCEQLNEIAKQAVFIKDRYTEQITEVRGEGLKIKANNDGSITIKCSYQYQMTCCMIE